MKDSGRLLWLVVGAALGALAVGYVMSRPRAAYAANDRVVKWGHYLQEPRRLYFLGIWNHVYKK